MSNTKLVTLEHLGLLAQRAKVSDDAVAASLGARIDTAVADIQTLKDAKGEENILEGVQVNGIALPIAEKLVNILIESGTENGTINVNGVNVGVKGLDSLAFLNKVSETELSDALKATIAEKATNADLSALTVRVGTAESKITSLEEAVQVLQNAGYQTAEQVETIAKAAVAASGHASFKTAESDPTAEGFVAEDNVMYLWPAADGDGYTIYAKVGTEMKLLGHTKVDLSQYSTTEQMTAAIQAAVADKAAMDDLDAVVERITAVEAAFANYYTKDEAEAKFTDETEAGTIAEEKIADAKATTESVNTTLDGVFGAQS